jgi:SAM-dependent methyltransferase
VNSSYDLGCPEGCTFPVIRGIPRFVGADNYADSFGLQWNHYRTTQLDSHTGLPISRERLTRCLGGDLEVVRGKTVLEAGCGAARFTEVLLQAGAHVVAFDLSSAVEANFANCSGYENYFVCQADLLHPPTLPGSFDIVLCLGVLQHTPNPEAAMANLARYVKPGGMLVIDHYRRMRQPLTAVVLRNILRRLPPAPAFASCRWLFRTLFPVHRLLAPRPKSFVRRCLRALWLRVSPLMNYYDDYQQLPEAILEAWMELDTHDSLTDYYKHRRTRGEIARHLEACGLAEVRAWYGGNGVEALARRAA